MNYLPSFAQNGFYGQIAGLGSIGNLGNALSSNQQMNQDLRQWAQDLGSYCKSQASSLSESKAKISRKMRAIDKLRKEIDGWHGDILGRECIA